MKQRLVVLCTCLILCSCNSSNDDRTAAPSAPPAPVATASAPVSAPGASAQPSFASGVPASSVGAAAKPSVDNAPDLSPGSVAYVSALYAPLLNDKHGLKLPFGTAVRILDPAECAANEKVNASTVCISRRDLYGYDQGSGAAGAQIDPATLGRNEPDLYTLSSAFDETPQDQLDRRRELAEKMFLLAPWNEEAYGQLTAVLEKTGDKTALRRAEFTHRCYSENEPRPTGKRSFYQFDDQTGLLTFMFSIDASKGAAKTNRREDACPPLYYIREGGEDGDKVTVGAPAYDTDYEISVTLVGSDGPASRPSYDPGAYPMYVTDFPWPEPRKPLPAVTAAQRKQLKEMLRKQLAGYTGKDAEQIARLLQANGGSSSFGFQILTGQLAADGRVFHLGQFRMGDAADSHYEDQPYIYAIAMVEQQPDGKFKPVEVTDRPGTYCGLGEVLPDIDGDGTDEIVGACEDSLDGAYPPILLRRFKGKWEFKEQKTYRPGDVIVRARPVE